MPEENPSGRRKRSRTDALGKKKKIVFILDSAGVAITDLGRKKNQVLCHDKDGSFLDAKGQPTWLFRPDIVHQMLLAVFDMPLCKEGHVQVFINTIKQKAIEVSPTTRIPRTFKRFCGLMAQLIDQGKVINPETEQPLFRVLPYPVRQQVPERAEKVFGVCNSEVMPPHNVYQLAEELSDAHAQTCSGGAGKAAKTARKRYDAGAGADGGSEEDAVAYFVIPCRDNAIWPDEEEGFGNYVREKICITQYDTSPVHLIHKISNAFERTWGV
ncbi:Ribosomal RNA small subunit methyltransferase nep-1 [Diplonema papillatum]|nr:Ribosomal RNA small subunit methyltransferase nep-1 [Diplonema papillatum]